MKPNFKLSSKETGTEYWIYVEEPVAKGSESGGAEKWPVMVWLDGDDQYAAGVEAYRARRTEGGGRDLLMVGVGYGASYMKPGNRRVRDYTPTRSAEDGEGGGAEAFLRFLERELWPELERRWPRIAGGGAAARGIGGHSLSALLVLHAVFQWGAFFGRGLASAPSIWWDGRSVLATVSGGRAATGEGEAARTGAETRLYLGVGEGDSESMLGDLKLLEEMLRTERREGLRWVSEAFAGRDHYDVLPETFRGGLRALWE